MIERLRQEASRFLRYGTVGAVVTVFLYLVYLGLIYVGVSPVRSSAICYGPGVALSYLGNRKWTFESEESHQRDLPKYVVAYVLGFLSTIATVWFALRWVPAAVAQIINIGVTPIVIFASLRILGFGTKETTT